MAAKTTPEQKRKAREAYLRRTYGIGCADYEAMLEKQGGKCAICLCRPRTKLLAVDHDHITGALRGLLCLRCNKYLLGGCQEDISILLRAVDYLRMSLECNASATQKSDTRTEREILNR